MKGHLREETLMDLLEGEAGVAAAEHAAGCPGCAARLAEARELLKTARGVDVPEPPALYWEAFRRSVNRRIAEERPRSAWRLWLVPAAVAAAAALALIGLPSRVAPPPAAPAGATVVAAWSPLPPTEEDEALPVLEGVAAGAGVTAWDAEPGLGPFLAGLTEEESRALSEALRDEDREVKL